VINANEATPLNVLIAGIAGILAALGTWMAAAQRFRRLAKQDASRQDVGLATLSTQYTQSMLDRYERQAGEMSRKVDALQEEVEKLQATILEITQRHVVELNAAETRHKFEIAAVEARYKLANEELEQRYQEKIEELLERLG